MPKRPMNNFDKQVLDWFTTLSLEKIKELAVKHYGSFYPVSMLDDFSVTNIYMKENGKNKT